ncbi:MAG: SIS domain-containing protein [Cardiobacteriaceae bacterium]|nr:SIS domain-containing protein [Cardiobacteriaceae bacterium]
MIETSQKHGAGITAKEIQQQSACWRKIPDLLKNIPAEEKSFLRATLLDSSASVIFTGAGTSGYVGDILAPTFAQSALAHCVSHHTTAIVANPEACIPTGQGVLFSFARSGNSPESVDAVEKTIELNKEIIPVNVTCNEKGKLAKMEDTISYLMPPETHDESFVMTSSFSTMTLFTSALCREVLGLRQENLQIVAEEALRIQETYFQSALLSELSQKSRLIYLGSGALYGATREASLKVLEMTAGAISVMAETSLGFRHGPKSFVNPDTAVMIFASNDPYTQQFDADIALELAANGKAKVVVIGTQAFFARFEKRFEGFNIERLIYSPELNYAYDDSLAVLGVVYGQLIGLKAAIHHGVSADNPSPDGTVNRVVQGVTLYPYARF